MTRRPSGGGDLIVFALALVLLLLLLLAALAGVWPSGAAR